MKYKAIMFDLDGTLIPMDYDVFTKYYFKGICKKAAENGITDSENLVKVIWAGTKDMVMNDGSRTNEEAFWERFTKETGIEKEAVNDFFAKHDLNSVRDIQKRILSSIRDDFGRYKDKKPYFQQNCASLRLREASLFL